MSSPAGRVWLRVERFLWFAFASAVGAAWVFYEAVTGREVPSHAHPVFAALVTAALMFGGVDVARVARVRRDLLPLLRDAGVDPSRLEDIAHRVAVLEVEEPELVRVLRAQTPARRPRPKTDPANPPRRRPRTQPGDAP